MRKQYCTVFIVSLYLTVVSAATGTLKGVVKDNATQKPLASAIVRLVEKGLIDTTDASGNFLFTSFTVPVLPAGSINASMVQPHYVPGKGIIFVNKNNGNTRVIFSTSRVKLSPLSTIPFWNKGSGRPR